MPIPEKYYKSARQDPRLSQCLHCGYDLSGSPEGKCPECGQAFTFAEIRAALIKRQTRTGFSRTVAGALIGLQCVLLMPILFARSRSGIEGATFAGTFLCALSLMWFGLRWREVVRTRTHERVWIALPIAALIGVAFAQVGVGYTVALLTPVLLLFPRVLCPRADRAKTWIRVGVVALVVCAPITFVMWPSALWEEGWTEWPDFRPGQLHRQYPLRAEELRWLFGVLLLYTSAAIASTFWRIADWTQRRKDQALKPPRPTNEELPPAPQH